MGSDRDSGTSPLSWRSLVGVIVGACLTVAAVDAFLQTVVPLPKAIREAQDGISDLASSNPDVLVLGSSHARSFEAVAAQLRERTGGTKQMVTVPEEGGTFHAFNWVLQERLRPLIEERDSGGRLVRDRLSRAMLITTYWDMCPASYAKTTANIPARAWTLAHYVRDVVGHGVTDFNRNFVQSRWNRIFWRSILLRDRGLGRGRWALSRLTGADPSRTEEERRNGRLRTRPEEFEREYAICDDPGQKNAFKETVDYFRGRGLDLTVVLFPLVREALTEKAKETTLKRYADYVRQLAREKSFRVADLTLGAPLEITDFEIDLDHVTRPGNRKFAEWALDNDLAFLLDTHPPRAQASATGNQ